MIVNTSEVGRKIKLITFVDWDSKFFSNLFTYNIHLFGVFFSSSSRDFD